MDELMADHGGFEHNRQTLRILEVLEERYPKFPGLNLTWEVREGIIKHQPDSDARAPAEYAPGEAPTLEAQLVDFVDEIAYNNHDIDDGLSSGMITVEKIRARRRCSARRTTKSRPRASADERLDAPPDRAAHHQPLHEGPRAHDAQDRARRASARSKTCAGPGAASSATRRRWRAA